MAQQYNTLPYLQCFDLTLEVLLLNLVVGPAILNFLLGNGVHLQKNMLFQLTDLFVSKCLFSIDSI